MSRCLAERGVDHVVLERGMVANSWRTERWNSLRLLTPNWQSRLPGYGYEGDDPDGYRTMPEVIAFLDRYAKVISAPVEVDTTVTSVQASDGDYRVETNRDAWQCRTVVLAAGACNVARIPECRQGLRPGAGHDHADDVPPSRAVAGRRRAGRRGLGDGHPARRRDPSLRPPGDDRRRRAHPGAPRLPRPGHSMVDGRRRRARRTLRRRSTTSTGLAESPPCS